jgi:F-type H+-transporting ATPase subunit b
MEKSRRQIESETQQALQQIKQEVATLTMAAAEKVVRRSFSDSDHMRMIQEAIAEIDLSKVSEN